MQIKLKYAFLSVMLITLTAISPLLASAETTTQRPLVVGTIGTITHLDPHKTYWSTDINAYMQVCEGLFQTNLSDAENLFPIAPYLATGFGTWDTAGLVWTIPLRQGVEFTDGTKFNASAVKWNYERIEGFIEEAICEWDTLALVTNRTWVAVPGASAAYNATKLLFILKSVTIVSEYEIALEFHYKDARAMSLMSYQGWVLLSPEAHSQTEPVALPPLVGTGPYTIESISADGSRVFKANENYWRTPAQVKEVRYQWVTDSVTVGTGLLDGSYDVGGSSPEQWDAVRADPNLVFIEDVQGTVYFYCGFNTKKIPVNFRKAMALAFNQTYVIETWFEGQMLYMTTPVTPGIPYAKVDCDVPSMDVTAARQILVDNTLSGALTMASTDAQWIAVAEGSSPLASYNVSYREGSSTWGAVSQLLQDNMEMIGIKIIPAPMDSASLDLRVEIPANHHMVDLLFLGWGPDYLDPHNMIYDAFAGPEAANPMGLSDNTAEADIVHLQEILEEAAIELNPTARRDLYYEAQCLLMEDIQPWIPLFNTLEKYMHSVAVTGMSYNGFGDAYWYCCEFNPPPPAIIPGYNFVALFGAIGIAALLLIRKVRK